jgi:hypothetical protein
VILIDSNIPMYLIGADHPHRADARQIMERLIGDRARLVTDAEVLQEILHRYSAIDRHAAIQPAFDVLLEVVDAVLPVEGADVERARDLILTRPRFSARDAIHAAIMQRYKIDTIVSFDRAFDQVPGITRLG